MQNLWGPRGVLVRPDSWERGQRSVTQRLGLLTSGQDGWRQLVRNLESFLGEDRIREMGKNGNYLST